MVSEVMWTCSVCADPEGAHLKGRHEHTWSPGCARFEILNIQVGAYLDAARGSQDS